MLLRGCRIRCGDRSIEMRGGCRARGVRIGEVLRDDRVIVGEDEVASGVFGLHLGEDLIPQRNQRGVGRIARIELVDHA